VTLSNTGSVAQPANPGAEFTDVLPPSLSLVSAAATHGAASIAGQTVEWNGALAPGGTVTITIVATVNAGNEGQLIANQGAINVDTDANGVNDTPFHTDDPAVFVFGTGSQPTVFQTAWGPADFFTLAPCRLADTRTTHFPLLRVNENRIITINGACGIPSTAKALSVNVAVAQPTAAGNLRIHPAGTAPPLASTVNFRAGQTRSNNAVVALNPSGQLAVFADLGGQVDMILDVNGYFE
jgi:uncharacterized repeat protein (TIGR01451 family)